MTLSSVAQTDAVLNGRVASYWTDSPGVTDWPNAQFNEHLTMRINGELAIDEATANNEACYGLRRNAEDTGDEAFEIYADPNRPEVEFRFPE